MSDAVRTISPALRRLRGWFGRSLEQEAAASGPRGRLFRKYAVLLVGLVTLVLLVNAGLDFWFSYDQEKTAAFRIQQEKAGLAARRIEGFVDEIERQLGWTTGPQWAADPIEQRRFDYVRLLRQEPAITELIQLDNAGKEQLKVSRLATDVVGTGRDYSQEPSFIEAKAHRIWFSPVDFRKESDNPYLTLAMAQAGGNAGVTVAEVNLQSIWDVIAGMKAGQNGYAYVIDRDGRLIAHPNISLVLWDTDLSNLPQVAAARAAAETGATAPPAMVAKNLYGQAVLTAHAAIVPMGWTVFVELPMSEAMAPLYASLMHNEALLAVAIGLATLAALFLARRMTVPIRQLQAGAARIGAGELDRRIDIRTGDELEELAGEFNRMAGDLRKSYAELEGKVEERTAELKEALDQQTATAEVLLVINSSPGELGPVFDRMLEKATQLCEAGFGILWTYDGERFHPAAVHGLPSAFAEFLSRPIDLADSAALGDIARAHRFVHVADLAASGAHSESLLRRATVDLGGARTGLGVPLLKDDALLGIFVIYRQEVRPFSEKQIALFQNFAAQAVIAMENARLITETREALEQQTATAEVLQVINSSPGDLAPVFEAMLEKATRLCEAPFGILRTWDGERFHFGAVHGEPGFSDWVRREGSFRPDRDSSPLARIVEGERVVQLADAQGDRGYRTSSGFRRMVDASGIRSAVTVALHKDDALLGIITVYRQQVRPFTDKQIALLQNFAAQAVIAMENARLLTETREALEQQTAAAEVLRVINSSPGELAPVFDAMLEKATDLCGAAFGMLQTYDGERFEATALRGLPSAYAEFLRGNPPRSGPGTAPARILSGEQVVHIPDLKAEDAYRDGDPRRRAMVDLGGARTSVVVGLSKDDKLLGSISAYRTEVRPFSDKQIALLQNFGAQAVIAMENARLLTETREALEQQTATAEALQVINSSPGDLTPVFNAMLDKALILCGAAFGQLVTFDGSVFRAAAWRGYEPGPAPTTPTPGMALYKLVQGEEIVHIADITADDVYRSGNAVRRRLADEYGGRTAIWVALRKDAALLGAFVIYRIEVRPFSDKQIALLQNFAAQAVVAMENARLLTETREALERQTATAEVLQVINSSPGNLTPVFDALLDKAIRLCAATHGTLRTFDGEAFHLATAHGEAASVEGAWRLPSIRPSGPGGLYGRFVNGEAIVHLEDALNSREYQSNETVRKAFDATGARSWLGVALRREEKLLGAITIYRQEIRPFTDMQIALLQNFAAQAVIAMENARLLTETREALEQQTATADVLQVINSSPGDLAPVFDAILEKAHSLCGAACGELATFDGEFFRCVACHGEAPFIQEYNEPLRPSDTITWQRIVDGESLVHIADVADTDLYRGGHATSRLFVDAGGGRTLLTVALRKDEVLLGALSVYRQEVRPFTNKQISLLENFAAQAVIAMENARLLTETREALEQQTATAEVLQVINSSPGDLTPVFDAMLRNAHSLCGVARGSLELYDGQNFRAVATHGLADSFADQLRQGYPASDNPATRPLIEGQPFSHILDLTQSQFPFTRGADDALGARTLLCVPLRRDDKLLGMIASARLEVQPFTEKQIALLQNFAAQAVIAMENARLLTETREALEQQTATAEVLQVINSSPGDLAPVFDKMLDSASVLCGAAFGCLWIYDGERMHAAALRGAPPDFAQFLTRAPHPVGPDNAHGRLLRGEAVVHIADVADDAAYRAGDPVRRNLVELGGGRTLLAVPLRKEERFLGDFVMYRTEVRPFTDKQIALLQNFAAQAVIAMENARLLTETREALEQQTAAAEVLRVINSSPGDLAPVFDAVLDKAMRLCGAAFGFMTVIDGERSRTVAARGVPAAYATFRERNPTPATAPIASRLRKGEPFIHTVDLKAERFYEEGDPQRGAIVDLGGARTLLAVPLMRDQAVLGAIQVYRSEVRPFTDKQVALLQNFAAQAVIAMENARLITELRQRTHDLQESLEYQTASSDVLKVISQSGGELEPVLDTLVETAARICRADSGFIFRLQEGLCRMAAAFGIPAEYREFQERNPIAPGRGTLAGRTVLERRAVHIEDAATDPEYTRIQAIRLGRQRTMLGVPLIRDDALIGAITLARSYVEPFSEKQIGLVSTFADQAVIAIENARLFGELRQRTHDLQEALEYQTASGDVLKVISQSGGELEPVLDTLVKTAARLCDVQMAFIHRRDGDVYRPAAVLGFPLEFTAFLEAHPIVPGRGSITGRVALEGRAIHIPDVTADPEYELSQSIVMAHQRTTLGVPLLRENEPIGVILLARQRVQPFTEKQIALVQTFADQAVIAIENARLFNELRERTIELGRSVDELKLLSDVGRAVSSTLDLRSVLSTILNASLGVTWANAGAIFRYYRAERAFRLVEAVGWDEALKDAVRELRVAETESAMGEAVARRVPIQLADLAQRASYPLRDITLAAGFRSALIVPLVGAERIFGAIILYRREAGEFPPETVRLLQTLASQSVLAIQNARLFREIADKSEQLALASQHKSQFLANMSHELRTPLNAILGYAELLVDGIYGVLPDRPKGVVERMQNNGKHLLALINDVLDLAKIEAGQLTLTLEDYSLPEVVKSVVTASEPLATSKGLKFTSAVKDDLPTAHGDARRVSQVLLNLVGNAIKFTDAGEIEIRAGAQRGQFILTVRDTGPGIADADQERIFGEFQQIDNSSTRKQGGTGLGLAIAKRMVELQGGTISVKSALGQGSTFRVVLPVRVDEMMEAAE